MDLFALIVDIAGTCKGLGPVVLLVKNGLFPIIQIGIPILLIIFGAIDLGKAVMESDEKNIKAATSKLIKRAITAVAVFFIVTIVTLLMNLVAQGGVNKTADGTDSLDWAKCWQQPS